MPPVTPPSASPTQAHTSTSYAIGIPPAPSPEAGQALQRELNPLYADPRNNRLPRLNIPASLPLDTEEEEDDGEITPKAIYRPRQETPEYLKELLVRLRNKPVRGPGNAYMPDTEDEPIPDSGHTPLPEPELVQSIRKNITVLCKQHRDELGDLMGDLLQLRKDHKNYAKLTKKVFNVTNSQNRAFKFQFPPNVTGDIDRIIHSLTIFSSEG